MEKSRYFRVIEGEEIRRDDPIEYFLRTGSQVLLSLEGVIAIDVSQNKEISGGGRTEGEKESILLSVVEE